MTSITTIDDPRDLEFGGRVQERLTALREQMTAADMDRQAARRALSQQQRQLADLTADLQMAVLSETNGDGRPRYGNEALRGAAIKHALSSDGQARALQAAIERSELDVIAHEQTFEAARRERADLLALLAYRSAWLGYWAQAEEGRP